MPDPLLARLASFEHRVGSKALSHGVLCAAAYEFLRFGLKQGWACLFGGLMLAAMIVTRLVYPSHAPLARYDALFGMALLIQVAMLTTHLETIAEAKVIFVFHVVGTLMELHKTAIGAWVYPEHNVLRIGGVPLFTGFMYACVGSYLARIWRLFAFRFSRHPTLTTIAVFSVAIYVNFLVDDRGLDFRWALIATAIVLFAPTTIWFRVWREYRGMPLLLGFTLVATFIWFAENIGTATGTWLYPRQKLHWSMVPPTKLASWFLLMIVSYTLVALLNGIVPMRRLRSATRPSYEPRRSS